MRGDLSEGTSSQGITGFSGPEVIAGHLSAN